MNGEKTELTTESFTVDDPMNDHGALRVRARVTNATYHVVEYEDDDFRDRLADLPAGSTVRLDLARAGTRASVWRVTGLRPGTARTVSTSVS